MTWDLFDPWSVLIGGGAIVALLFLHQLYLRGQRIREMRQSRSLGREPERRR